MVGLIIFLISLSFGLEVFLWNHYRVHIMEEVEKNSVVIDEYLSTLLRQNAIGLQMALLPISLDNKMQEALVQKDVDTLISDWRPIFEAMKKSRQITDFSFLDINRINLVRFHDMKKKGDKVDRTTLLVAEESGQMSWGVEIENLGSITLRVVQPIYIQGVLIGYVELGQDIENAIKLLHLSLKNDLAVSIQKAYLEQKSWEEVNQVSRWDDYPNSVISYTSLKPLPKSFAHIADLHQHDQYHQISENGKEWIVYTKPFRNAGGETIGDLLIIQDISKEKESFREFVGKSSIIGIILLGLIIGVVYILLHYTNKSFLAQEEALSRLEKIASHIPGLVYQFRLCPDGSSCLPFASNAIEQMYGLAVKEANKDASKILHVIHPDDVENVVSSIHKSAKNLTTWKFEYRIKLDDGTVHWHYGNAMPEKEEDGSILWHGFVEDITDQKTLEHELKKMNEMLDSQVEKEVAARMKIQEEQDMERQLLIQKAKLSSMGEMMGAIAHQWRQPLNALNMNIQNLDDDFDEGLVNKAFIDKFIAKNRQTILFMSKTIDDFRNFFKIDKAKKEFSVLDAITETLSLQSAQFKNCNICVEVKGEDQRLYSFRGEFQQVILNIINNAKDAILGAKREEGKIDIVLEPKSITIEDNGGGIKAEILDRIFEPYFTTKDQGEGTGIGLYMSKMIVEKNMGWRLESCNTENGAKFTIFYEEGDDFRIF